MFTPHLKIAAVEPLENRRLLSADLSGTFAGDIPTSLGPGGSNKIIVRLTNGGDATALGPANVALYASADPAFDSTDTYLGETSARVRLKAGAARDLPVRFDSPTTLPDGSYYLVAKITAANGISVAGNGVFATASPLGIQQPYTDIVTAFAHTPTLPIKTNGNISTARQAAIELVNIGNVTVRQTVVVNLYLSSGAALNASAAATAKTMRVTVKLPPGGAWVLPERIVLPVGTMPGSYRLFGVTTRVGGAAQNPKEHADNVAAAADALNVVGTAPDEVIAANYHRHHHRHCVYYNGPDYCADDGAVYGDSAAVVEGNAVPTGFVPPAAPSNPTTGPSSQPASQPAPDSWDSGLPDASTVAASDQSSGSDSSSGGDFSGGGDGGDSSDSGDDSGDDGGGDGGDDSD